MGKLKTFEEFMNESLQPILEKLDISEDLAKVKSPEDLVKVCNGKFLIIHSKHSITNTKKRGGDWPSMWFIRGFGKGKLKVDSVGHSVFGGDINKFAHDSTGYSITFSPEEVYDFFLFNRQRGNRIYTISELPISDKMLVITDMIASNHKEVTSLLRTDISSNIGNKDVSASVYVVTGEGQSHGERFTEFTAEGKDYTFYYNVYSYKSSLKNGRSIVHLRHGSYSVFRVDREITKRMLTLYHEIIYLYDEAMTIMGNFYKKENISPK